MMGVKNASRQKKNNIVTIILFFFAALVIVGPLYLAIIIALKTPDQMSNILALPNSLNFDNFVKAWEMTDYPRKFGNTLFITVVNLVFTIFTNSAAAYAIERNRKKRKIFNALYYYFISAMFIPFNVLMLPLVKQADVFNLDNILGITFLYIVFGLPMNTFLYTGFIKSIPVALDEAAKIDGASPIQVFRYIIFPTLKPMTATVAILSSMWTWNDFLMPLVLLSDKKHQTLQLAQYVFQGQFNTQYNLAFASYLLVLLPVLIFYIICQKWIMSGVVAGSVKQ
ncbi:carbohydrate ABC transporter permease [Anaerosacchariphilus polymeriproducens]|uniref:Carbohydrate ABC transporter permease n=1 Tax=Anaerosacchariphilus polymeriproducens TaxID=1812858 RepID=A0A371AUF9_9FIRM|nr:carbohydrate ABC transporter permease [Anaerosacchariphilus polymeriproducens]RDU23191.1 carbohydrate ABC transporter permease [Anaerosacchariphilus polymeriproducens]